MKRRTVSICAAVVPMLFLWNGCLDEYVKTKISPDGSSERVITMNLDSKQVPEKAFPLPTGSGWQVEWKEVEGKKSKYEYTARKSFGSPDELMREYTGAASDGAIGISVSLHKSFQWFFTYLEYKERFIYHNPFHNLPVTDFLSSDDIQRFQRGEGGDSLKNKVDRWKMRDMYTDIYRSLIEEAKRRNDPNLPATLLVERKAEMFNALSSADSTDKAHRHIIDSAQTSGSHGRAKGRPATATAPGGDKKVDNDSLAAMRYIDTIMVVMKNVLGTDAIRSFRQTIVDAFESADKKEKLFIHPDMWYYSVDMPGLILSTNSDKVEGNVVSWKFEPDQVRIGEYAMEATSRVTNVWAFVVTGLLAVAGVILTIRRR